MAKSVTIKVERSHLKKPKRLSEKLLGPVRATQGVVTAEAGTKEGLLLPGVEIIGRGFDVLHGNFATSTSTMEQLFDIKDRIGPDDEIHSRRALAYASCERLYGVNTYGLVEVEPTLGGDQVMYTFTGERVSTVQTKLSGEAEVSGNYGAFEGEVEVMASTRSAKSASSFFCQINGQYPKYVLRLKPFKPLWDLLLPEVRMALSDWTPEQLKADFFPVYGGFYLHNAVIGGCVKYWAARRTNSTETEKQFEASMKACYKFGTGKVTGSAKIEAEKKDTQFHSTSESQIRARGGTSVPDYGTEGAVNEWIKTILDAPELIDFDNGNGAGCRPVWSLIDDDARANVVQQAFLEYVEEHKNDFDTHDPDLVTLYGYKDWKTHNLRRWFYSRSADHARGKNWGDPHHNQIKVYASARPGCTEFTSVRKTIEWGPIFNKKSAKIYKVVKGKVPNGWKRVSTFYAPTKPLSASLDTWTPIYEYTRQVEGTRCGKHYNTRDAKVGAWTRSKNPVFYAVI